MPYTFFFASSRLMIAARQGPLLFEQRLREVSDLDFAAVKTGSRRRRDTACLISFVDAYTYSSFPNCEETDCTGSI